MAFRLMRLLRLYQRQEEHCVLVYQEALARQQQAEDKVYQLEHDLLAAAQQLGLADGEQLQKYWTYRGFIAEQLTTVREKLLAVTREAEQAQEDLLAVRQQRKTLESLKEKYETLERREQARKEQVVLDEAGLRSFQVEA